MGQVKDGHEFKSIVFVEEGIFGDILGGQGAVHHQFPPHGPPEHHLHHINEVLRRPEAPNELGVVRCAVCMCVHVLGVCVCMRWRVLCVHELVWSGVLCMHWCACVCMRWCVCVHALACVCA